MAQHFAIIKESAIAPLQQAYETYRIVAQTYRATLLRLVGDPATVNVFPDMVALQLIPFLSNQRSLERLTTESLHTSDITDWANAFYAFVEARGLDSNHLPEAVHILPRLRELLQALQDFLYELPADIRDGFPQGFVSSSMYNAQLDFGSDPHCRTTTWTRLLCNIYRFMTECYPSQPEDYYGPQAAPRWLAKSDQARYLQFLCSPSSTQPFYVAKYNVLAFLLGPRAAQYQDDRGAWSGEVLDICAQAEIALKQFYELADFHEHLLSNPMAAAMNCSISV
ncbi:hypothetical protein BDV29DRAFT_162538 [Aspergillus leporis]|uniref:Uncharacterized protein n=1 Tax=Aspergillus leporis TaxID=41062 RepID=A0A5N5WKD3_9EURO|nr:hypothetical protein BDV29DRAFT_162538 [Aspergillus leporis]